MYGLLAALWIAQGRQLEFWVWSALAALSFAQGVYLSVNKNKPVDDSPAALRRHGALRLIWDTALLLPLAWVIAQATNGTEMQSSVWALSIGLAAAGAVDISIEVWRRVRGMRQS